MLSVFSRAGRTMVVVHGDLDEVTIPALESTLAAAAIPYRALLSIDLSKCTYIGSLAVSTLVRALRTRGANMEIRIADSGNVKRVFEISGLLRLNCVVDAGEKVS